LNNPIEHYREMETIFGNNLATGAYAKRALEPLATEVSETQNPPQETEDGAATNEQQEVSPIGANGISYSPAIYSAAESSGSKPPPAKKAKVANIEDPNAAIVSVMSESIGNLAIAVKDMTKSITADDDILDGLYDDIMGIPGFDDAHLDHYYAYLCEPPSLARAFAKLRLSSKMVWVARYIKEHLSDV
jgi:hypothetical protein